VNKWETNLIKWLMEHCCPKPPKPKPRLDFNVGPVQLKNPQNK